MTRRFIVHWGGQVVAEQSVERPIGVTSSGAVWAGLALENRTERPDATDTEELARLAASGQSAMVEMWNDLVSTKSRIIQVLVTSADLLLPETQIRLFKLKQRQAERGSFVLTNNNDPISHGQFVEEQNDHVIFPDNDTLVADQIAAQYAAYRQLHGRAADMKRFGALTLASHDGIYAGDPGLAQSQRIRMIVGESGAQEALKYAAEPSEAGSGGVEAKLKAHGKIVSLGGIGWVGNGSDRRHTINSLTSAGNSTLFYPGRYFWTFCWYTSFLVKQLLNWPRKQIHRLYNWTAHWAETKNAEHALAGLSFAESSFFPIPPDPLLMAIVFSKGKDWKRLALITTIASVLGGMFGYFLGTTVFDSFGDWIVGTYHLEEDFATVERWFRDYSFVAVLGAAFTPIPYKLFTLSAGFFSVNFFGFVLASLIGRGGRFFAVSALANYLGMKHKDKIEKYIDIISITILLVIVLSVVMLNR